MFCSNCGKEIPAVAVFCPNCGASLKGGSRRVDVDPESASRNARAESYLPEGIFQDENGAYHWVYEQRMWKHPVLLWLMLKIGVISSLAIGLIMMIIAIADTESLEDGLHMFLVAVLGIGGVFIVILLIAFLIVTAVQGGVMCFIFTMDERKVVCESGPKEKERGRKAANIAFALSFFDDDPSMAAAGIAAGNNRFSSNYKDVRALISVPKHDQIKVNNLLMRNIVYAYPHQYAFVWNYITVHCPGAKIKR